MSLTELGITKHYVRLALLLALLITRGKLAFAERLPIKTGTTADGLADNTINRIKRNPTVFS